MSKVKENMVEETEVIDFEEAVEEKESTGFISKTKTFMKKNGKKILTGVGVAAVGLIGVVVGKGLGHSESYDEFEEEDYELIEDDPDESDDATDNEEN